MALEGVDLEAVQREVDAQCDALPRGDTARQALSHSCVVRVDTQARPCRCPGACSSGPRCYLTQTDQPSAVEGLEDAAHVSSGPDGVLRVQQVCGSCRPTRAVRIVSLHQQSAQWGIASARGLFKRHSTSICSWQHGRHKPPARHHSLLQSHVNCKRD